jgi:hypothetical protein
MGNLSFEGQAGGWKKLTGWLSLSTDPFKSRRAQLSVLRGEQIATLVIPGCATWRRPGIHAPDGG